MSGWQSGAQMVSQCLIYNSHLPAALSIHPEGQGGLRRIDLGRSCDPLAPQSMLGHVCVCWSLPRVSGHVIACLNMLGHVFMANIFLHVRSVPWPLGMSRTCWSRLECVSQVGKV